MKLTPIQESFAAGELTPRFVGRVSDPVRRTGLGVLENMVVVSQGPAVARGGSYYVDVAENDDDIRMIPFNLAVGTDYALAFTPGKLRIYNSFGRVDTGSLSYIKDGFFIFGGVFWDEVERNGGTVTYRRAFFACDMTTTTQGGTEAAIQQKMPAIPTADIAVVHELHGYASGTGTLHVKIGTTLGGAEIQEQDIPNGEFLINVTPTTEQLYIEYSNVDSDSTATVERTSLRKPGSDVEITTPYTADELRDLQYQMISANGFLIICHSNHHPQTLNINPDNTWTFQDAPFNYDETTPPGTPIWSAGDYPGVCTIFQGRLYLARTNSEKQRLWGSNSGTFFDFYISATPVDSDMVDFTLATPGQIEWLEGQKELLMGTDMREYLVTSTGGVITPTDIDIISVSSYGTALLQQAVQVGDQVAYMSQDRRKIRLATFNREQEWFSPDITWRAEHITANNNMKEIHYARDPDNQLVMVTETGQLLGCVYQREQDVIGWSRHFNETAFVKSACITTTITGSRAFAAMKLDNGTMVIAVFIPSFITGPHLDNTHARVPTVDGDNDIVEDLDVMEGMEVGVTIDAAVHPAQVVGAAGPEGETAQPATPGRIYLQFTGDIARVGLQYTAKMQTLPLDAGSSTGSGSAYVKHWNKIIVRVQDSAKVIVNGRRNPTRFPSTPMGQVQPSLTEDIPVANLGRDTFGLITIEQDLPLPLTVLSLFGEVEQDILG